MKRSSAQSATTAADRLFRRARKNMAVREDEALNAICDARLRERRRPLLRLLKKLAHELAQ